MKYKFTVCPHGFCHALPERLEISLCKKHLEEPVTSLVHELSHVTVDRILRRLGLDDLSTIHGVNVGHILSPFKGTGRHACPGESYDN